METVFSSEGLCFYYGATRVKREAEGKLSRKCMVLFASTSDHVFTPPHPQILPIVVFFSTVMSVLYYVGLMQWVVRKVLE